MKQKSTSVSEPKISVKNVEGTCWSHQTPFQCFISTQNKGFHLLATFYITKHCKAWYDVLLRIIWLALRCYSATECSAFDNTITRSPFSFTHFTYVVSLNSVEVVVSLIHYHRLMMSLWEVQNLWSCLASKPENIQHWRSIYLVQTTKHAKIGDLWRWVSGTSLRYVTFPDVDTIFIHLSSWEPALRLQLFLPFGFFPFCGLGDVRMFVIMNH